MTYVPGTRGVVIALCQRLLGCDDAECDRITYMRLVRLAETNRYRAATLRGRRPQIKRIAGSRLWSRIAIPKCSRRTDANPNRPEFEQKS